MRLTSTNAKKMLFAAIPSICALSSKKIFKNCDLFQSFLIDPYFALFVLMIIIALLVPYKINSSTLFFLILYLLIVLLVECLRFNFIFLLNHTQTLYLGGACVVFGLETTSFYSGEGERGSSGSETSVNQEPQQRNAVGPSGPANPAFQPSPEPVPAAPIDPDVYQPLLSDEIRKQELGDRLRINAIGQGYSLQVQDSIVSEQFEIEKKIEQALLSDGYSRDSILAKRHQIRGFIFYPRGTAFSESTYCEYLDFMENYGTHRSLPYQRLMEAIYGFDLSL